MSPWKQQKWQILPVSQNLSSIYIPLAKFQLVSSNPSLAIIWQMIYTQKLPKLCSATLIWPHSQNLMPPEGLGTTTPLKTLLKISKRGFFFQCIYFTFHYSQLFCGLPAEYCSFFIFHDNKTLTEMFIVVTKFRFKLTSSSERLIGSIGVQLPVRRVRRSWDAFCRRLLLLLLLLLLLFLEHFPCHLPSRTPPSSMSTVGTSLLLSLEDKGEIVIFGGIFFIFYWYLFLSFYILWQNAPHFCISCR